MNILPINEWQRIFVDTSFIIDCISQPKNRGKVDANKLLSIDKSQELLSTINTLSETSGRQPRWVVSSITMSELLKFDDDLINEICTIFSSSNLQIANFTSTEADFIVRDFASYISQGHISKFFKEHARILSILGVFNAKSYIQSDSRIIACAKINGPDVVLTTDKNSFIPIATTVKLPVLNPVDIPVDLHGELDFKLAINTSY